MVYCKKTRRQFLVGTGKTLLALPFLPSLLPSTAQAQAASAQQKMMLFWFDHNNSLTLWPLLNRSAATTSVGSIGAKEVLLRSLGTAPAIGLPFRHPLYQTLMNADLVSVMRGFDTAQWDGTHGNYTVAAGAGRNSEGGHPSIDTIIEASSNVYPLMTTSSNVRKAIRVDMLGVPLFYQRVGTGVQQVTAFQRYEAPSAYNQVFSGLTAGTTAPADNTNQLKTNILNRVYESYVSFKDSRKISADDRARLDQHMSFISQIQAGYSQATPVNSCQRPMTPAASSDPAVWCRLYLQLLAIAFQCGLTKCGTMFFDTDDPQWMPGVPALGTGFHNACHGGAGPDIQRRAYDIYWPYYTDNIAEYFLKPLNTEEGSTGRTYLQNMVTGFVTSAGTYLPGNGDGGHSGLDSQQILIGNMGGRVRSGRYTALPDTGYNTRLPYNCFLLTLLQLMGVQPSEYQNTSSTGQGIGNYTGFSANHPLQSRFYSPVAEILT